MIRIVIADDSAFLREVLADTLKTRGLEVVGSAKNGKEAIALVKELKPDILVLDCEMPVMHGLEALARIMAECPLPVFMFSTLTREGASVTIKALELGALDFLPKPTGGAHDLQSVADELVQKIRFVVMKSKFERLERLKLKPESGPINQAPDADGPSRQLSIERRSIDVIAMGSSTGGVQAAVEIIPKLPAQTKPIVWVQHMPPKFTKSFAERLDTLSAMKVQEAADGMLLETGNCYLAPGGFQMTIGKIGAKTRIRIGDSVKVNGHCPSCNVLFNSVAECYSDNALGVILTGMGDDGTEGLANMHSKGAFVIGQDERSCIVYGMPKAAFCRGAVDVQCDLKDIHQAIAKTIGLD